MALERPEEMRLALSEALGVEAVVAKRRRLFLWNDVRIHLDDVEELGAFIEFEAMAQPGSDLSRENELLATLRERFELMEADLVAGSYCDLLLDGSGMRTRKRRN